MKIDGPSITKLIIFIAGLTLLSQCGKKKNDDLSNIVDNTDVLYYQNQDPDCTDQAKLELDYGEEEK